jgi:phenylacetate-CoA ligase
MPIIRYSIGDIGVPSEGSCSCGITLPLMKIVEGRKDSFLILPGDRVLSPMIFNFAMGRFKYYTDVDMYRIHQRKIDYFEVEIKMHSFSVVPSQLASELESHLKSFLGLNGDEVRFNISFVDDIPIPKTGKLMSVSSDLNRDV